MTLEPASGKSHEKTVPAQDYEQREYDKERTETPAEQLARLAREMEG